jgi:hypothetical protein
MEQIPVFLRWIQYLCGLKWAMNITLAEEFGWDRCSDALKPACASLLKANDIEQDDWLVYVAILIAAFAFFRLAAVAALVNHARHFY